MSTLLPTKVHLVTFKLTTNDKYNPDIAPTFAGSSRISSIDFFKALASAEPDTNQNWDPVRIYANSIEMMSIMRDHIFKNFAATDPTAIRRLTTNYLIRNQDVPTEYIAFRLVKDIHLPFFAQSVWNPEPYPNFKNELDECLSTANWQMSELRHTVEPIDAFYSVEDDRLITELEMNDPVAHDDYHELLAIFESSTPI